jgi:hypothetical protein
MRISVFAPYGPYSQESGVIYLLSNYLSEQFPDVVQLRCNGLFSVCARDSETNWKRDFDSCMMCMSDQAHLQRWSGVTALDASRFVSAEEVEASGRWLQELEDEDLVTAALGDATIYSLCESSFEKRVGTSFDVSNKRHVQVLRRMILTVIRTHQVATSFQRSFSPDLCFIADGKDMVTGTFAKSLAGTHTESVLFRWDAHKRSIFIKRSGATEGISCDLLLDGVSNMRADRKTWPRELTDIINEILEYLDLKQTQLRLPMAG